MRLVNKYINKWGKSKIIELVCFSLKHDYRLFDSCFKTYYDLW